MTEWGWHEPCYARTVEQDSPALSGWHRMALAAALVLGLAAGMRVLVPPSVRAVGAPAESYSAARAIPHLERLAQRSRAVGTPGHDAARDHLQATLEVLGLETHLQRAPAHVRFEGSPGFSAGRVENVVARIPGTASTGAIVLNAHYDSGSTGPGAGDCGVCVVAVLETVRALVEGPPLTNDVIVVFSDAEENGDLGAAAFIGQHPWAANVRVALNIEAQGTDGPALLYATSEEDGWILGEVIAAAPGLVAFSWVGAVSHLYPAGQLECDLEEYDRRGVQGVGFVHLGSTYDYHTRRDSVAHVDPRTVQQHGTQTLAIARHLGAVDLSDPPRGPDQVFFSLWPGLTVRYPVGAALPITAASTFLLLVLLGASLRRNHLHGRRLVAMAAVHGAVAAGAIVIAALAWWAFRSLRPDLQVPLIGAYDYRLHAVAWAALAGAVVLALLVRRPEPLHLAAAALLGCLPFVWLLTLGAPAMSYSLVWPLVLALPLAALGFLRPGWPRLGAIGLAAVGAVFLLPSTLHQVIGLANRFEGAAGLPVFGIIALWVVPPALLALPAARVLAGTRPWVAPLAAFLVFVGLAAFGWLRADFDAERPRPDHVAYEYDADEGQAHWVSLDADLDDWTRAFFGDSGDRRPHDTALFGPRPAFIAEAPRVPLASPTAELSRETETDGGRRLELRLGSARGAPMLRIGVNAEGPIASARLDGEPLDLDAYAPATEGTLMVSYVAPPAEGVRLTLEVGGEEPVSVVLQDVSFGHPAEARRLLPARPAETMPAPTQPRDGTLVRRTWRF